MLPPKHWGGFVVYVFYPGSAAYNSISLFHPVLSDKTQKQKSMSHTASNAFAAVFVGGTTNASCFKNANRSVNLHVLFENITAPFPAVICQLPGELWVSGGCSFLVEHISGPWQLSVHP